MPSITKRPPKRGGATREIELSNAMCARALGGSRNRKAWMSGNGWSSKIDDTAPFKRPNINMRATLPTSREPGERLFNDSRVQFTSEQDSSGRISAPRSDSNVPAVYSSSSGLRNAPRSPQLENVLPSPALSEEHHQENACIIDLEAETEGVGPGSWPTPATGEVSRRHSSLQSEKQCHGVAARQMQNAGLQEAGQSPTKSIPDALSSLTEEYGGLEAIRKRLRDSDIPRGSNEVSNAQRPSTRSGPHLAANTHSNVSTTTIPVNSSRPPNSNPQASIVESSTSMSAADAIMHHFSKSIAHRKQQVQGEPGSMDIQVPRLHLLLEATQKSDLFYVILHQMYCLNSRLSLVHSMAYLGFKSIHSQGLATLNDLLLGNDRMGLEAVEWFSNMPSPLEKTLQTSSVYRFYFGRILVYLSNMSQHWIRVKEESKNRSCPPSANEMAVLFGLHSHILQGVLFRAILRELWPGVQDQCFQHCEKVFHKYQGRSLIMAKPSTQLMVTENQTLFIEIKRIWAGHRKEHVQQQPIQLHPNVPQMAPPQQRRDHNVSIPYNLAQAPAYRDLQISTFTPHHIFEGPPGVCTPIIPSSPSDNPPLDPAQPSRTPSWSSSSSQRPRPTVSSVPNLPSVQSPIPSISAQDTNRQTRPNLSVAVTAPPGYQFPNQTQNVASPHPSPRTYFTSPSQAAAYSRIRRQNSNDNSRLQMNEQMPSPLTQSNSPIARSQSHVPVENPYLLSPSAFLDIGKSFIHPTPANPPAITSFSALHQAHVMSPPLSIVSSKSQVNDQKCFMFLKEIGIGPERLHARKRHLKWSLNMRREDVDILAVSSQASLDRPLQLNIELGSRICRLRCVKVNKLNANFTESDWVAADNTWPSGIAIILNNRALEIRKKLQHGKDLPVNVTSYLKEGENDISIAVSKISDDSVYAFAAEFSQIIDATTIKAGITKLNWQEAKNLILRHTVDADPDVQILGSEVNLDLTDPYTSSMCNLPVRGKTCNHRQCFDLDIFLSTRSCKANEPCGTDQFRCPICGADARPQSLIVDGFLIKVREELQRLGRIDAKVISLNEDGNWQILESEVSGESGDGVGRRNLEEGVAIAKPHSMRYEGEIIDLDSDE